MKKLIMEGPKKSKITDVPIPKINDDEILVKVRYTGMCHSEFYPWTTAKKAIPSVMKLWGLLPKSEET